MHNLFIAAFINNINHLLVKIIRSEEKEKTRLLKQYLARLYRATLCYSKSLEMLKLSIKLLLDYLKYKTVFI